MQLAYACVRGCTCWGWEGGDGARFTPEMLTAAPATGSSPLLCTQPSQLEGFQCTGQRRFSNSHDDRAAEALPLVTGTPWRCRVGGGFAAVHLAGVQKALLGEW